MPSSTLWRRHKSFVRRQPTCSGLLLASAIFAIGNADVFDAKIQWSGMC